MRLLLFAYAARTVDWQHYGALTSHVAHEVAVCSLTSRAVAVGSFSNEPLSHLPLSQKKLSKSLRHSVSVVTCAVCARMGHHLEATLLLMMSIKRLPLELRKPDAVAIIKRAVTAAETNAATTVTTDGQLRL